MLARIGMLKWHGALKVAIDLECGSATASATHAVDVALRDHHFEEYVLHYDKALAAAFRCIGPPLPLDKMFPLETFAPPWDQPFDYYKDHNGQLDDRCRRSIVIWGAAGCGKTARACSELARPLLVNTPDDLRKIVISGPRATTHLVFDQFNPKIMFDKLVPAAMTDACINLIDSSTWHGFSARYSDIQLPPIPRIFTTNLPMTWPHSHIFPPGSTKMSRTAFFVGTLHITSMHVCLGALHHLHPKQVCNELYKLITHLNMHVCYVNTCE